MSEIYISTDIETDGPIPGPNSMLSFGSAAYSDQGRLLSTFAANLELLDGANPDEKTMSEFWSKQPEAWSACRKNLRHPKEAMSEYVRWVKALPGTPVFVGYPATFDFMFVYWYLIRVVGESPFSFSALDIKTYTMAVLKKPFRESTKRNMPKDWFPKDQKHTHVALDDAIEQGQLFMNILRAHSASCWEDDFRECDECRAKPGAPLLCSDCVERRNEFFSTNGNRKCRPPRACSPVHPSK